MKFTLIKVVRESLSENLDQGNRQENHQENLNQRDRQVVKLLSRCDSDVMIYHWSITDFPEGKPHMLTGC